MQINHLSHIQQAMQTTTAPDQMKRLHESAPAVYQQTPVPDGSVSKVSTNFDALLKNADIAEKQNFDL